MSDNKYKEAIEFILDNELNLTSESDGNGYGNIILQGHYGYYEPVPVKVTVSNRNRGTAESVLEAVRQMKGKITRLEKQVG